MTRKVIGVLYDIISGLKERETFWDAQRQILPAIAPSPDRMSLQDYSASHDVAGASDVSDKLLTCEVTGMMCTCGGVRLE